MELRVFDRLRQLGARLGEYNLWEVALEVGVLCVIIYAILRFVRGTRAAGALKGLLILLVASTILVRILASGDLLPRLGVLYDQFLAFAAIVLVVTFQPELRRALIRLGEAPLFRGVSADVAPVVDAVVGASTFLSKNKFGAIIAIERNVGLRETVESGRQLNADVSSHLLNSIFWPSNPLHDMGVVIRNTKIVAASVQFPLADPHDMPEAHLGTRHRAAVGLARTTDAIVVVVSEETGGISLAEGSTLSRWLSGDELRAALIKRLSAGAMVATEQAAAESAEALGETGDGGEGERA